MPKDKSPLGRIREGFCGVNETIRIATSPSQGANQNFGSGANANCLQAQQGKEVHSRMK